MSFFPLTNLLPTGRSVRTAVPTGRTGRTPLLLQAVRWMLNGTVTLRILLFGLCLFAWTCVFCPPAFAQQPLTLRKLYVPEEDPSEWPRNDWRPMSSAKFLRLLELTNSSDPQAHRGPSQQIHYDCDFENGALRNGRLKAELSPGRTATEWFNLGRSNLPLRVSTSEQQVRLWGSGLGGDLFLFASPAQTSWEADWSLPAMQTEGGQQFHLELLPAPQSTLTIRLPPDRLLTVLQPAQLPVFRSSLPDGRQAWVISALEKSSLVIQVETAPELFVPQRPVVEPSHVLEITPSERTFLSEFSIENLTDRRRLLEVELPDGFLVDSVRSHKETLTTWTVQPATEQEPRSILRLRLPATTSLNTTKFSLRGILVSTASDSVETDLPRLRDAVTLNSRVNVAVHAPLQLRKIETTGMRQSGAQFVNGGRDIWSYDVTTSSPRISLQVHAPAPSLTIDQVTVTAAGGPGELAVRHLQLWSTSENRVYGTSFVISPKFEVEEVLVLGDSASSMPISWNTLRRDKRHLLVIELANQLIPGKSLPLGITLKTKLGPENPPGTPQLTLPALVPVEGRLRQNLLNLNGLDIRKTIPDQSPLPDVHSAELTPWSALANLPVGQAGYLRRDDWRLANIGSLTRILADYSAAPAVLQRAGANTITDPFVVLETRLVRSGLRTLAQYRLEVPNERRDGLPLTIDFPVALPDLSWRDISGDMVAVQSATNAAPLAAPIAVRHEYRSPLESRYVIQAPRATSRAAGPLVLEAFHLLSSPEGPFPLPLPRIAAPVRHRQLTSWNPAQFQLNESLIPVSKSATHEELTGRQTDTFRQLLFTALPSAAADPESDTEPASPSESWPCRVRAIYFEDQQVSTRVAVVYRSPAVLPEHEPTEFWFETPVNWQRCVVNGVEYPVDPHSRRLTLPAVVGPLRSIELEYTLPPGTVMKLPQTDMPVELGEFLLCVPPQWTPEPNEFIASWRQIHPTGLLSDAVPPQASANRPTRGDSASGELIPNEPAGAVGLDLFIWQRVEEHGFQLFQGLPLQPETASLNVTLRRQASLGMLLSGSFLATLLLGLLLSTVVTASHSVWFRGALGLLAAAVLLAVVTPGSTVSQMTLAVTLGVVVCSQIIFLKSSWQRTDPASEPEPTAAGKGRPGVLAMLLKTGLCVSLAAGLLSVHQVVVAQNPLSPLKPDAVGGDGIFEVLIPVPARQLKEGFQGVTPEQMPGVVYVTAELAQAFSELSTAQESLGQLLYESARYDCRWTEDNQLLVACEFSLIDADRDSGRSVCIVPISNFRAINSLKAQVNGRSVNIVPLADGSGLEIPLPPVDEPANEATNNADSSDRLVEKSLRRYNIRFEVIADQQSREREIQTFLKLPPVSDSQIRWTGPAGTTLNFAGKNQLVTAAVPLTPGIWESFPGDETGQLRLRVPLENITGGNRQPQTQDCSALLNIYTDSIRIQVGLTVTFPELAEREIRIDIPASLLFQNLFSADVVRHTLQAGENNDWHQLHLVFASTTPRSSSVLFNLILPVNSVADDLKIPLPRFRPAQFAANPELSWQLGINADSTTDVTAIEFPETASTRLTREAFQAKWSGIDIPHPDGQYFRVKAPREVRAVRRSPASEIRISAGHELQLFGKLIELKSAYRGQNSGSGLWSLDLQNPQNWEFGMVNVVLAGRSVVARKLNSPGRTTLFFSEPLTGPWEIQVHWRRSLSSLKRGLPVTPPRPLGTQITREQIELVASGAALWTIAARSASSFNHIETALRQVTLIPAGGYATALPDLILEKVPADLTDQSGETQEPVTADAAIGFNPQTPRAIPDLTASRTDSSSETQRVSLRLDHSLWIGPGRILGETVIVWPREKHPGPRERFLIELPGPLKLIDTTTVPGDLIKVSQQQLVIEDTNLPGRSFRNGFAILRWEQPLPAASGGQRIIPLPDSSRATSSWRLFRSLSSDPHARRSHGLLAAVAAQSWQDYSQILQQLGYPRLTPDHHLPAAEADPASNAETDRDSVSSTRTPITELPEFPLPTQLAPSTSEQDLNRGASRLALQTWTMPFPEYFQQTEQAGWTRQGACTLKVASPNHFLPIGIVLATVLWGGISLSVIQPLQQRPGVRAILGITACLCLAFLLVAQLLVGNVSF